MRGYQLERAVPRRRVAAVDKTSDARVGRPELPGCPIGCPQCHHAGHDTPNANKAGDFLAVQGKRVPGLQAGFPRAEFLIEEATCVNMGKQKP